MLPGADKAFAASERSMLWNTAIVVIAGSFVLWYLSKLLLRRKSKLPFPPGPKGLPFLGNVLDFPDQDKESFLDEKTLEWSKEFGLVYTIKAPFIGRIFLISDPVLAKQIFITDNYQKAGFAIEVLKPVMGERSMAVVKGKEWAAMRKAFNAGFAPNFLKDMVGVIVSKLERLIKNIDEDISNGVPTNMLKRAQTFTADVIVTVAFGEDWGGSDTHVARAYLTEIAKWSNDFVAAPVKAFLSFGKKRRIKQVEKLLDEEMIAVLERRLAAGPQKESKDICSLAIHQLKQPDGSLTTDDKVAVSHQLKTFYFAGHDTTSVLLSWSVWLLSQNDYALAKLRSEVQANGLWMDASKPPCYEDIQKCKYLDAVVKETLRLYPPVGAVVREPQPETTYNGWYMGDGMLCISAYVMHRHPMLWNRPNDFVPDRFLDGSEPDWSEKFMPFSRGPRDCIGRYFAYLEVKLALSALVMRYDIECVDPRERIYPQLTNMPRNGAEVRFHQQRDM